MREALLELFAVPLSPQQRDIVKLIAIHGPVTSKRLYVLFYDTPAPPTRKTMHALAVIIRAARLRLEPHGWTITRGESPVTSEAHRIGMMENRYELFKLEDR